MIRWKGNLRVLDNKSEETEMGQYQAEIERL
jgi:hypothetical protein